MSELANHKKHNSIHRRGLTITQNNALLPPSGQQHWSNGSSVHQVQQLHQPKHKRCESGSTGYSFPDASASNASQGSSRNNSADTVGQCEAINPQVSLHGDNNMASQTTECQAPQQLTAEKKVKKVQFINCTQNSESSIGESHPESGGSASHESPQTNENQLDSSGEGTMVSRISNPSLADGENNGAASDYLQALNSVMYSSNVGEDKNTPCQEDLLDGSSGSRPARLNVNLTREIAGLTQEEDQALQQQIIKIRDKIRRGELLSCQLASEDQKGNEHSKHEKSAQKDEQASLNTSKQPSSKKSPQQHQGFFKNCTTLVGDEVAEFLNTKKSGISDFNFSQKESQTEEQKAEDRIDFDEEAFTPEQSVGRVSSIQYQRHNVQGTQQKQDYMLLSAKSGGLPSGEPQLQPYSNSNKTRNSQRAHANAAEDLTPSTADHYYQSIRQGPKVKQNYLSFANDNLKAGRLAGLNLISGSESQDHSSLSQEEQKGLPTFKIIKNSADGRQKIQFNPPAQSSDQSDTQLNTVLASKVQSQSLKDDVSVHSGQNSQKSNSVTPVGILKQSSKYKVAVQPQHKKSATTDRAGKGILKRRPTISKTEVSASLEDALADFQQASPVHDAYDENALRAKKHKSRHHNNTFYFNQLNTDDNKASSLKRFQALSTSIHDHAPSQQHRRELQKEGGRQGQQSATYSPVSNCITTDASNIYEKKRQRMEKIKQLRGISSQSGVAQSDASGVANSIKLVNVVNEQEHSLPRGIISAQKQLAVGPESARITSQGNHDQQQDVVDASQSKAQQTKKYPTSQPSTPRRAGMARFSNFKQVQNLVRAIDDQPPGDQMQEEDEVVDLLNKKFQLPHAPNVTNDNSHATNSLSKPQHVFGKSTAFRISSNEHFMSRPHQH